VVNVSYSATLQASGGATPYTWSISAGTLPAGLTLTGSTGVIAGTPTTQGTSNFTVKVKDKNAATATKALSIVVNAAGSCVNDSHVAPWTYCARNDLCETGTEAGCTGKGLSFLGRNSTDVNGVYTPIDTAPNIGGLTGLNKCITDPDFHSKICRVTDYSLGTGFNAASVGANSWASDDSAFFVRNNGGAPMLFSFSADSNMTSVISDIHNVVVGGDATHFAGDISFSTVTPNVMYELDGMRTVNGKPYNQLNKLVIDKTGGPANWKLTRTKLFNLNTDSTKCMPADFFPNWDGTFQTSANDKVFQIAFSDHGQNGARGIDKNGVNHPYGATIIAEYTVGKGCRILNTYGTNGVGPMTITGDWGDLGTALNGIGMPVGVSGGSPVPDVLYLHGSGPYPGGNYSGFNGSDTETACTAQTCSCWNGTTPHLCGNYIWETGTRNIRNDDMSGHAGKGYLYMYKGTYLKALDYHDTSGPLTKLLTIATPGDIHVDYDNPDTQDDQPVFLYTTKVCGQAPGMQGQGDCDPAYNAPLYDEILSVENQAAHPGVAQHCDYGAGKTACTYRFGHTFNTGTHWNFYTQNVEGNVSPSGRFVVFPSDWNMTLGCTNGTASGCLDNITASTGSYCVKNFPTAACR
jgi:hypothetical protein